jgi:hypothetical protein
MGATGSASNPCGLGHAGDTGSRPNPWHPAGGIVEPLSVNGDPPHLAGQRCNAVLCQQYWHRGELVEAANVVFLCFEGRWHRLYFDYAIVFWRTAESGPEPFQAPELESDYPVVDLAEERGLRGVRLLHYRMEPLGVSGAQVTFAFENGARLAFRCIDDVTSYEDD